MPCKCLYSYSILWYLVECTYHPIKTMKRSHIIIMKWSMMNWWLLNVTSIILKLMAGTSLPATNFDASINTEWLTLLLSALSLSDSSDCRSCRSGKEHNPSLLDTGLTVGTEVQNGLLFQLIKKLLSAASELKSCICEWFNCTVWFVLGNVTLLCELWLSIGTSAN